MSGFRARLTAIESRLAAVEQRVGAGADVSELDQEIDEVVGSKHAAADAQDYEQAARLRDREIELHAEKESRQEEWAVTHPDLSSLAETVRKLGHDVQRLAGLLRQDGIGQPGEGRPGDEQRSDVPAADVPAADVPVADVRADDQQDGTA